MWDVTLTVQAILSTGLVDDYRAMLNKANHFIKNTQLNESYHIKNDNPERSNTR